MGWIEKVLAVGLLLTPALAGEPDPAAAICAQTACRPGGYAIKIAVDKERYTTIDVTHSPYVDEAGDIIIFPGETLIFRLPSEGDKLGKPQFVAEYAPQYPMERVDPAPASPAPQSKDLPKLKGAMGAEVLAPFPEGTFIVTYGQEARSPATFLLMTHNLAKSVKADAVMMIIRPGKYEPQATSTCPVMSKTFGMEH